MKIAVLGRVSAETKAVSPCLQINDNSGLTAQCNGTGPFVPYKRSST